MENENFIRNYLNDVQSIARQMPVAEIDRVIETLFQAWMNQNAVYIMGNGGSASTASHFASDLSKVTAIPGKKRLKAFSLSDNIALITAWINDESFDSIFVEQLRPVLTKGDIVIVIS